MAQLSVVSVADRARFHTFASALRSSDLIDRLEGAGPFTVFAPTDAAFNALPADELEELLHGDREHLRLVLGYHVAVGRVGAARFADKRIRAVMQSGGHVIIDGRDGLRVNTAHVIKPDLAAANGVVHGIDALLRPRDAAASVAA